MNKLFIQIPAAIFILVAAMAASAQYAPSKTPISDPPTGMPAQPGGAAINPTTGLPFAPGAPGAFALDPATGLANAAPFGPQWMDPNWGDPDIVLTNLSYDGLPLSEVARDLRERFKNDFDILPMPTAFIQDWGTQTIQLQLKNVRASEVFNAMNQVFENDRTPLRWELKVNTKGRQFAQLRVLPDAAPKLDRPLPPPPKFRQIVFVGDLLGDEKTGGMTMEQLVKTVSEVWRTAYSDSDEVIQFHKQAQLLIANGTPEQNEFIQQTLMALRQKAMLERSAKSANRLPAILRPPLPPLPPQRSAPPEIKTEEPESSGVK